MIKISLSLLGLIVVPKIKTVVREEIVRGPERRSALTPQSECVPRIGEKIVRIGFRLMEATEFEV
jgi:hypothetical protein